MDVGMRLSMMFQWEDCACDRGGVHEEDLIDRMQGVIVDMGITPTGCASDSTVIAGNRIACVRRKVGGGFPSCQ